MAHQADGRADQTLSKVPEVTLAFWVIKIAATTTAGTTMADFPDRSLGIGYVGGSLILLALTLAVLGVWRWSAGSASAGSVPPRSSR